MIPEFPKFKKLSLKDKEEVESFTKHHSSYSDLNFTELWAWNLENDFRVSNLDGNLVVKLRDYLKREPFFAVQGEKVAEKTLQKLFEYQAKKKVKQEVVLVPEEIAKSLKDSQFEVVEDDAHFDYIFDLDKLINYKGEEFKGHREATNTFLKKHNKLHVARMDVSHGIEKDLMRLCKRWDGKNQRPYNNPYEKKANNRMIENWDRFNFISIGVYRDGNLVAATINEPIDNEMVINHAVMFEPKYQGVYYFLLRATAIILKYGGYKYSNVQQDLGQVGLRRAMMSYLPVKTLKKYRIRPNK